MSQPDQETNTDPELDANLRALEEICSRNDARHIELETCAEQLRPWTEAEIEEIVKALLSR